MKSIRPKYLIFPEDRKKLPLRRDFLDPTLYDNINNRIKSGKDITFKPIDIRESLIFEKYYVRMFGITPDGRKTMVKLENIPVYFDVLIPPAGDHTVFADGLKCTLEKDAEIETNYKIIQAFQLLKFQQYPDNFVRLFFRTMQDRKKAIKILSEQNFHLSSDDPYRANSLSYFNKIAREYHFNTTGWNQIPTTRYTRVGNERHPATNCEYCFIVDIADIKPLSESDVSAIEWLKKDKTLVMTWDIETYTFKDQTGRAPKPTDDNYIVFMICMSFHWHYTDDALYKVCIMCFPCSSKIDIFYDDDIVANKLKKLSAANAKVTKTDIMRRLSGTNVILECKDEENVLKAFIEVSRRMAPDMIVSFNGGGFDWPIVRQKMYDYGLMREMKAGFSSIPIKSSKGKYGDSEDNIFKYAFRSYKVKMSAGIFHHLIALDVPGIIDTDCMVVFKQLYSREEVGKGQSLNFYLKINKLGGKVDLPYTQMFKYVEEARNWAEKERILNSPDNAEELLDKYEITPDDPDFAEFIQQHKDQERDVKDKMAEIAKYCSIDAFRCQQLYVKRTIVYDKSEICNMAYVPLMSGFYYANGVKVENLVGAYCSSDKFNIVYSSDTSANRKVKYVGATVFDPETGLNIDQPVVGLDFAALYPSLMMTYNISPEMTIEYKTIDDLKYARYIKDQGYILHYIDFTGKINEEDSEDNGEVVRVRGWTVRHSNIVDPEKDKPDFSLFGNNPEDSRYIITENPELTELEMSDEYRDLFTNEDKTSTRKIGLPNERMGVMPYILTGLVEKRMKIKVPFGAIGKLLEKINSIIDDNIANGLPEDDMSKLSEEDFKNTGFSINSFTYDDLIFEYNMLDSKQRALKVYMNTFYGVEGFYISKLHKLLAAGAVTQMGRYNIGLVANYIRMNNYKLWYGDTDSNYISCPKSTFEYVDCVYDRHSAIIAEMLRKYDSVNISSRQIQDIHRIAVNKALSPEFESFRKMYKAESSEYKKSISKIKDDEAKYAEMKQFNKKMSGLFDQYLNNLFGLFRGFLSGFPEGDENIRYYTKFYKFRIKEEYHIQIVQITRRDIDIRKDMVNKFLIRNNGSKYLKMAYEEVLNGTILTGKKKYAGMKHEETENFHPKDLFIRGLDFIKQGQPELSKTIGLEILHEALSIENERELIDICEEKLREIYEREWNLDYFILRKKYDPSKKNVPVLRFADRMQELYDYYSDPVTFDPEKQELYEPPEPGERFPYIMVKKTQEFSPTGNKIVSKNGDRMEYVRVYNASQNTNNPMEIDLGYYIESNIIGLLARFISYHPKFRPNDGKTYTYDELDKYVISKATKHLKEINNGLSGVDKKFTTKLGAKFRTISKNIIKLLFNDSLETHTHGIFFILNYNMIEIPQYKDDKYYYFNKGVKQRAVKKSFEKIIEYTENKRKSVDGRILLNPYREDIGKNPEILDKLLRKYDITGKSGNTLICRIYDTLSSKISSYENQIMEILYPVVSIMYKRSKLAEEFISEIREQLAETDDYDDPVIAGMISDLNRLQDKDSRCLQKLYDLILELQSNKILMESITKMFIAINEERNKFISSGKCSPEVAEVH